MRWILETLKTLASEGVMLGKKSKDKYLADKILRNNNLEKSPGGLETYSVRVDASKERCSHLNNLKCKLSEAAETQKIGIRDFVLESSYVKNMLGYEKRFVQFLSPFPVDEKNEAVYCCDGCYYKYKLETIIDMLDYASLDIEASLFGAIGSGRFTLIGLKKKLTKKEINEKSKEEEVEYKKMVALSMQHNGQVYLIARSGRRICLLCIAEHVFEGGVNSRHVYLIRDAVTSAEKFASITENDAYKISYVEIDRIYRFDSETGQAVNIVAGNASKFRKEYEAVYPDDTMFADIRAEVKRVARSFKPMLSAEAIEEIDRALGRNAKSDAKTGSSGAAQKNSGDQRPAEDPAAGRPGLFKIIAVCIVATVILYYTIRLVMPKSPPQMRRVPIL
ncbi:uncharacterized protein VICG_01601 [Vittaforma corneae ATCC 50505]|uniref:Uncharacterized protein n=1 Tax=Vittaforma corneae (strain ATCC 50505) TaxID=993615 RepID=L2GLH6_VITCO|nr:uncharacterized protein VICG_01601 [Vittaforma corneae ATCC 50505]ELA41360.1 hypothetical protein VICG_01601 [Vittaforma corneae ATCC 50505]